MWYQPTSSPQITRMFGFFASWARAGSADPTAAPRPASARTHVRAVRKVIIRPRPRRGRPGGRPLSLALVAHVTGRPQLLDLLDDLLQIVGFRRLHRRVGDV